MGLRAVFLDLGGTLLDPASDLRAHRGMMEAVREAAGLGAPPEALWDRFEALRAAVVADLDTQWKADSDLSRRVLDRLLAEEGQELTPALWEVYREASWREHLHHLRMFPETEQVLAGLGDLPVHVGLVSDTDEDFLQLCCYVYPVDAHMDAITTSDEVGVAKPHPTIFRTALEKAGVGPEEAVHVGDSPERDVAGARALGIRTVLLARDGPGDAEADHVVPTLRAAYDLVRRLAASP